MKYDVTSDIERVGERECKRTLIVVACAAVHVHMHIAGGWWQQLHTFTSRLRQISRDSPAVRSTAVKDFSILQ